jgi:hypothetical protein
MAETVEIEVHIVRRSASALLVHDGEREAWLPKSQVKVLPVPSRERLSGVVIERGDFEEVLDRYDGRASFFYCDPPYWGHETLYCKGVFAREDFERLAAALGRLKGRFLMSIGDTPEVRAIFARFRIEEVATV